MPLPTLADFQLDSTVIYLNHGSFGAVPRVVQAAYEDWQHRMERNPTEWMQREVVGLLAEARGRLGAYIGSPADDLVFFPNPTTAVNMVARSLRLAPGDEVLTTDHEYGAMWRTWRKVCAEAGATYVRVAIPLPVTTADDFVDRVWSAVTPRTKVLFLDHMTSATALTFPMTELCRRARQAGIVTIVDGAHVPGHIPLDVSAVGCDVYTGALHKWLCAPKGCSFLYARPEAQAWLQPLVVSWGWESDHPSGSPFVDHHEWQGSRDNSASLSVGAALDFVEAHDWPAMQAEGHRLAIETRARIDALTGLSAISPDSTDWIGQMASIRLPDGTDGPALQRRLFDQHRIEVAMPNWQGTPFLRVSFGAYNTQLDADALVEAMRVTL